MPLESLGNMEQRHANGSEKGEHNPHRLSNSISVDADKHPGG